MSCKLEPAPASRQRSGRCKRWERDGRRVPTGPMVRSRFIGLALASVLTWTIAIAKAREIMSARRGPAEPALHRNAQMTAAGRRCS